MRFSTLTSFLDSIVCRFLDRWLEFGTGLARFFCSGAILNLRKQYLEKTAQKCELKLHNEGVEVPFLSEEKVPSRALSEGPHLSALRTNFLPQTPMNRAVSPVTHNCIHDGQVLEG